MPVSVEEYRKLKSKVDDLKAKAARAEGAYDEAMKRLKEAGYSSIEDAEAGLVELKKQEAEAEEAYESELERFKAKWGDRLG